MYVNATNLSLISEHPNTKCSAETLQRFRTMYQIGMVEWWRWNYKVILFERSDHELA